MASTRETRMYAHYRGLKRRFNRAGWNARTENTASAIWMPLARTWRTPIAECKRIIAEQKAARS